jgi:Tol biopolymer transport system component
VHSLETARTRPLAAGFDGAGAWSPDSRWLAFVSGGKLRKIDVEADGPGVPICDVAAHAGLAWPSPNTILFADVSTGVIMQVSADGGTAVPRTKVDVNRGELRHILPQALPGGRHFLYVRRSKVPENDGIFVGDVDVEPEAQELRRLASFVQFYRFAPSIGSEPGHLLFVRAGVLMAQAFDEKRRVLSGDAVPVVELAPNTQVAASATGIIAFTRRPQFGSLVWVGRDGNPKGVIAGRLRGLENPRLSNDERKIAVIVANEVWRYDLDGRPPTKLTFDGNHLTPLWTRDDSRVVSEGQQGRLVSVPADGSGRAPEPASPTGHFHPYAWSRDGHEIVAERWLGNERDLVRLQSRADGQLETLVATPAREGDAASMSPNGQWLAYTSDSLGQEEVFVMPFSRPGAALRVSPRGGSEPVWARTGRELFYLEGSSMMSVAVQTGATFSFSPPTRLFDAAPYRRSTQPPSYDVAADGRFVMVSPDLESSEAPITVIVNWSELLHRRALAP